MLAGGTDALYRRILAAPHRPFARIAVYDGNNNLLTNFSYGERGQYNNRDGSLVFYSASVQATLTSRVARNLTFTCHEDLYPELETDLLAPYGNIIRAWRGVETGDGDVKYAWQVFGGRIQDPVYDSASETLQVQCADFAADVIDNGFLTPHNSAPGTLCTLQMQSLIREGYPAASFGPSDSFDAVMPQLTWESDRGGALDEIGQSLGAFWYPLADERFVIRTVPWTVPGAPVITFRDGDGGMITRFRVGRSRSDVYNAIAVTGERADGSEPVYAVSQDFDPNSPTRVTGTFGQRTRQAHLQTPVSQGQVQQVANDLLKSSKALTESWDLEIIPDASLELGDVIGIEAKRRTGVIQVISGFNLPLDLGGGGMSLQLRSQVPGLTDVD